MKKFPKIVFIGSTSFSLQSLKELYIKKYNIVGIITRPDNIFSRKKEKIFSPIKKYAIEHEIPLLQPKNLLDSFFLKELKKWNPDIQIVVSFRILPKKVWNFPKMGSLNLHASLLPQYKGAAPINWAIINGETETGITTFFIEKNIDSGKILLQKKMKIGKRETAGELENKLKKYSGSLIIKTLEGIINNKITPIIQKIDMNYSLKLAPKIYKKDCRIQWKIHSIDYIYNKIRGLSPFPTAWTLLFIKNKFFIFKIFFAEKIIEQHDFTIGSVFITLYKMKISVKEGFLSVIEGQIEGKNRMNVKNLINGLKNNKNIFVK
ncbi:methionyl-tRNA formyltransferase [Blattabacterium cuenoti]|uniref:methionyl-tRNA formyltransferase n=1 Tax=Blattabacterium cuenoti TaxID=1653831 RepID=UPI00163BBB61|nr:methionyl-tRNA formyltransferase [Blattabacterium cuenoti]